MRIVASYPRSSKPCMHSALDEFSLDISLGCLLLVPRDGDQNNARVKPHR